MLLDNVQKTRQVIDKDRLFNRQGEYTQSRRAVPIFGRPCIPGLGLSWLL